MWDKLEREEVHFVNLDYAFASPCSHFEHDVETKAFAFKGTLAVALNDDIGFFKELVQLRTIGFDVQV